MSATAWRADSVATRTDSRTLSPRPFRSKSQSTSTSTLIDTDDAGGAGGAGSAGNGAGAGRGCAFADLAQHSPATRTTGSEAVMIRFISFVLKGRARLRARGVHQREIGL